MLRNKDGSFYSDLLNIITLQIPCIQAKSLSECKESYEILLNLLNQTSKKMKTKEDLMKEIDGLNHLAEETKEMFRRMVATMNHDLTPTQLSEYMADLNQYESEMNEFATARREGAAEQKREIARNLKENGINPELIAKCCGLPLEKIAEL